MVFHFFQRYYGKQIMIWPTPCSFSKKLICCSQERYTFLLIETSQVLNLTETLYLLWRYKDSNRTGIPELWKLTTQSGWNSVSTLYVLHVLLLMVVLMLAVVVVRMVMKMIVIISPLLDLLSPTATSWLPGPSMEWMCDNLIMIWWYGVLLSPQRLYWRLRSSLSCGQSWWTAGRAYWCII